VTTAHRGADLKMRAEELLSELFTSKVLTAFEPQTDVVPGVRVGQARYIATRLARAADDDFIKFPRRYGRHTVVAGICMFLKKDHGREYLVTAFGRRKGRSLRGPTQFDGLHVSHGDRHAVNFSERSLGYLRDHVDKVRDAEVLIFHNHPGNWVSDLLSRLMDWSPLPSNADRETMWQFRYESVLRWLASGRFQHLRFYLVEAGRLREFHMPAVDRIASLLNAARGDGGGS
jgi:hypothetical protein